MKKLMLLAVLSALSTPQLQAQEPASPPLAAETKSERPKKTPEERARKDADWAEKKLDLNADQKTKWQAASLQRIQANTPLREKMRSSADKAEKQKLGTQLRDNGKKFEEAVNGFLTPDQKTKWDQAKKEKKEHRKHKMKSENTAQPVTAPQD